MTKPKLLFLAHRFPFPANKGEKLRALNFLKGLAPHYDIWLGAPVDDPADWEQRGALDGYCVETCIADARGNSRARAGVSAVMSNESVTYSYFRHPQLMSWVEEVSAAQDFDAVLMFSSGMAPYFKALARPPRRTVMDFVDVDSEKWSQLSLTAPPGLRQIYTREGRLMRVAEREIALQVDASLLISDAEAGLFRDRTGVSQGVEIVGNGVDLEAWQDGAMLPSPYEGCEASQIVFTGAMNYGPNVEAALWFAAEVMPLLQNRGVQSRFVIAGGNPAPEIEALSERADILVTGRVEDMRPYLAHADLAVAPLQLARGVQNKVLEAMAASTPVVVTPEALAGIDADPGAHLLCAKTPSAFADAVADSLLHPARAEARASAARELVDQHYGWPAQIESLLRHLDHPEFRSDKRTAA